MSPAANGMSAVFASFFARIGDTLVRVAPPRLRESSPLDVGSSIEEVCLRAYGNGGFPALVWNGICEWAGGLR